MKSRVSSEPCDTTTSVRSSPAREQPFTMHLLAGRASAMKRVMWIVVAALMLCGPLVFPREDLRTTRIAVLISGSIRADTVRGMKERLESLGFVEGHNRVTRKKRLRVLLIEDNPGDVDLMREMLSGEESVCFDIEAHANLADAPAGVDKFDVAPPIDLELPDSYGLDASRSFRAKYPQSPIVVLSGSPDDSMAMEVVREGALDFAPKATQNADVLRGTLSYAVERHRLATQLANLAHCDQPTEVYKRHAFSGWIQEELARAARYEHPITFLVVGVDDFKAINDQHGHEAGDLVLDAIATALQRGLRLMDRVFRFGGDAFLVVLPETRDNQGRVAAQLRQCVQAALADKGTELPSTSVSIGTGCWTSDLDTSLESVLCCADEPVYKCKRAKRENTVSKREWEAKHGA